MASIFTSLQKHMYTYTQSLSCRSSPYHSPFHSPQNQTLLLGKFFGFFDIYPILNPLFPPRGSIYLFSIYSFFESFLIHLSICLNRVRVPSFTLFNKFFSQVFPIFMFLGRSMTLILHSIHNLPLLYTYYTFLFFRAKERNKNKNCNNGETLEKYICIYIT